MGPGPGGVAQANGGGDRPPAARQGEGGPSGVKGPTMKRFHPVMLTIASVTALAAGMLSASIAQAAVGKLAGPLCQTLLSLCADAPPGTFGEDDYVGHDEPSVLFKSGVPGSGNDITYTVTLPRDPKQFPTASGATGTTWNFQLRPTFWFGLTLCDTESAPEFTKTCKPDTDANDLVGANPAKPNYIGRHPGNAYMELQFYPPGYVEQFEGFGCTAHQYCVAMTIDSLSLDQNHTSPPSTDPTARRTTRTATTSSSVARSRSIGPTSPRVVSLRLLPTRCSRAGWRLRTSPRSTRTTRRTCS